MVLEHNCINDLNISNFTFWPNNEVKGCVIKNATRSTFDHVVFGSEEKSSM